MIDDSSKTQSVGIAERAVLFCLKGFNSHNDYAVLSRKDQSGRFCLFLCFSCFAILLEFRHFATPVRTTDSSPSAAVG